MRKMIRTQGYEDPIWVIHDTVIPDTCPECGSDHSLNYIGFVQDYTPRLHGKMHQCRQCDTWVDIVWSKKLGTLRNKSSRGGAQVS